jgi:hypothetical protein
MTPDALLLVLEEAASSLGEITGRTVREDVVEHIFSRISAWGSKTLAGGRRGVSPLAKRETRLPFFRKPHKKDRTCHAGGGSGMRAKKLTVCALLTAAALVLSRLEALLPAFLPVPGFKPGLPTL